MMMEMVEGNGKSRWGHKCCVTSCRKCCCGKQRHGHTKRTEETAEVERRRYDVVRKHTNTHPKWHTHSHTGRERNKNKLTQCSGVWCDKRGGGQCFSSLLYRPPHSAFLTALNMTEMSPTSPSGPTRASRAMNGPNAVKKLNEMVKLINVAILVKNTI